MTDTMPQDCQGVYPARIDLSESSRAALITANVILTLLNIFVNIFLVYSLSVTKQLQSISCRLFLYLSLSDIFVGLFVQNPVSILLIAFPKEKSCLLELIGQFTSFIFPQISGVMIMIIAIDRWLHMKFLTRYKSLMNMRRAQILVVANITLASIIATASIFASLYKKFFIFNVILVATDVSVIIVIYIAYVSTFQSVRRHMINFRKRNKEQNHPVSSRGATQRQPKRSDTKLAKTMVFILTSLTVCYLPYLILGLYWSYIRYHENKPTGTLLDTSLWWCFILVYLNSTLNAAIFIRRNKKTYKVLKCILGYRAAMEESIDTSDPSSRNYNTRL